MAEPLDFGKVKDFIESYAIHRHLYNMPPDVRKRFSKKMESKDYSGHHKYWPAYLENVDQAPPQFPYLTSDNLYEELYSMFQAAFENMSENRSDLEKAGKEDTTLAFLDKWYGAGKLFDSSKPVSGLEDRLRHFADFLTRHASKLKSKISGLPEKFDYNNFISDLRKPDKYNDTDFRAALNAVAGYVQANSTDENAVHYGAWPTGVPAYDFTSSQFINESGVTENVKKLNDTDPNKWFTHVYNPAFKHRLPELFDKLVSSDTVFKDFTTYDSSSPHPKSGTISKKIQSGLDFTAWDKTDSDDYVKPKDDDEKNIWQRFEKAKEDFVANHIDPWTDMLRGRRRFFSPYARAIIEACGKVKTKDGKKIKPTDGLQGILDNKDAILKKLGDDPKGKPASHFDWITKKLAVYADTYPKAFAGAFKNPRQMKKIVSAFIIDGLKESKVAQVKTALEMLSVMKYGMFSSKTMQELKKAEFTFLSDKGLSWNKYEAPQKFTKFFDTTLKYGALTIGYGVAAIRNKWFRDHTKFRGKTKFLDKAHDKWKKDNKQDEFDANVRDELELDLRNALADRRLYSANVTARGGKHAIEATINTNKTNKDNFENQRSLLQQELAMLEQQLSDNPNIITDLHDEIDDLNNQITQKDADIAAAIAAAGPHPTPADNANINHLRYERQALVNDRDSKQDNYNRLQPGYLNNLRNNINNLDTQIATCDTDINNDQKLLDDKESADNNVRGLIGQVREVRGMSEDWESKHGDNYMKLMSYWDMLETYGKSHQNPWFRSMKDVRDEFTEGFDQDKDTAPVSQAKIVEVEFWNKYKQRHAA